MAWQAYVDNLIATGHVDKAAVIGHNGAVWAASAGWGVKPEEYKAITTGWSNSDTLRANGLKLAGEKFMVIRADDQAVLGKKNATGVVIVKTKQAFVVGYHNDKQQIGNTNKEVQKIADYLIEQGY